MHKCCWSFSWNLNTAWLLWNICQQCTQNCWQAPQFKVMVKANLKSQVDLEFLAAVFSCLTAKLFIFLQKEKKMVFVKTTSSQASKLHKVQNLSPTHLLTGVTCRATRVAKNKNKNTLKQSWILGNNHRISNTGLSHLNMTEWWCDTLIVVERLK